ncbi:MAG: nucleotide sugar dehydrogenase [Candidatus Andersenbacteria bacterium]
MNTEKNLVVVGLGYVGLPLALLAQEKGWQVTGLDVDTEKVEKINKGISPLEDAAIEQGLKDHPIAATTNASVITKAAVMVVAVPTPVTETHEPDLGPLKSALNSILPHLQNGQLLSIESTINPGVMDEVVIGLLKTRSDLKLEGNDALQVVHCPERINPGDKQWTIRNIPRVIGGYTEQATQAGKEFYESIVEAEIKPMGSLTEAEAVKIFENTFRDINIAFVNEMAKSFDKLGINVTNVIAGASTKPFAFLAHYPGNGVGGHCISVDPYYMIERARQVGFDHQFLKLARQINDSMPQYALELMDHGLQKLGVSDPTVALLGLAYKKNIDDVRESPCLTIRSMLEERNVNLRVFDPHVLKDSTVSSLEEATQDAQVVIIGTNHDEFVEQLTPEFLQSHNVKLIVDGKNALDESAIKNAGILYYGIGRSNLVGKK